MDRERVIKDLEFCVNGHFKVELSLAAKILALLKEQESERLEWIGAVARLTAENELMKKQEAVVRCKDCAYALFKEGLVQHEHIVCTKPFTERWQAIKPDNWYCADGERRGEMSGNNSSVKDT